MEKKIMQKVDFSTAGIKEAIIKVANVTVYIVVSMIAVGLGMYVADQSVTWEAVRSAVLVAGANLLLVFLEKWLSTKP